MATLRVTSMNSPTLTISEETTGYTLIYGEFDQVIVTFLGELKGSSTQVAVNLADAFSGISDTLKAPGMKVVVTFPVASVVPL